MNEIISGIRVIKMYAWEYAFRKVVTKLRRWESVHQVHRYYTVSSKFIIVCCCPAGNEATNREVWGESLMYSMRSMQIGNSEIA